jgi:hypothetical protein
MQLQKKKELFGNGLKINNTLLQKLVLAFILLITFVLCVKQAIPFDSFDELALINWIRGLEDISFPALEYPPFFIYIQYLLTWFFGIILSLLGFIDSTTIFLRTEEGYRFILEAGRIFNAGLATLLVLLIYKIGKNFYTKSVGMAGALLTSCNFLVILYAHAFKPDIPAALLVTLGLYFLLKYHQSSTPFFVLTASFFFGLGIATRFNAFPFLVAIPIAIMLTPGTKKGESARPSRLRAFLFFPVGLVVGFLSGAPNWIFKLTRNISLCFKQKSLTGGSMYEQLESNGIIRFFERLGSDMVHHLGLPMLVLLAASLLAAFISRNRKDLIPVSIILVYLLILPFFGYYADHYVLPVYPVAALLVGKFIFIDIANRLRQSASSPRFKAVADYVVISFWFLLGGYALFFTAGNTKSLNLLKTQSQNDRIIEYREQHNIDDRHYHVGRQIFTPRFENSNIKLTQGFNLKFPHRDRQKRLHFIQAHLQSYHQFIAHKEEERKQQTKKPAADVSKNKSKSPPVVLNRTQFIPFYEIRKRNDLPWTPESIFLYRLQQKLTGIQTETMNIRFPRIFYAGRHTSFLPLQLYEKNPLFGKLDEENDGTYGHWLYSTKKIKSLKIWLFSPRQKALLSIRVNDKEVLHRRRNRTPIEMVELKDLSSRSFHHDHVYRVEILAFRRHVKLKPIYFVLDPVYEEIPDSSIQNNDTNKANGDKKQEQSFVFPKPVKGSIPGMFSNRNYPSWVIIFFKKTGINLPLLSFLSTGKLFTNPRKNTTLNDVSIDFIALQEGDYFIRLKGEPIIPSIPLGTGAYLEYTFYGTNSARRERVPLESKKVSYIHFHVKDDFAFLKLSLKSLRFNNFLINEVTVTPNYLRFVNKNLLRRNVKKRNLKKRRSPKPSKQKAPPLNRLK